MSGTVEIYSFLLSAPYASTQCVQSKLCKSSSFQNQSDYSPNYVNILASIKSLFECHYTRHLRRFIVKTAKPSLVLCLPSTEYLSLHFLQLERDLTPRSASREFFTEVMVPVFCSFRKCLERFNNSLRCPDQGFSGQIVFFC